MYDLIYDNMNSQISPRVPGESDFIKTGECRLTDWVIVDYFGCETYCKHDELDDIMISMYDQDEPDSDVYEEVNLVEKWILKGTSMYLWVVVK